MSRTTCYESTSATIKVSLNSVGNIASFQSTSLQSVERNVGKGIPRNLYSQRIFHRKSLEFEESQVSCLTTRRHGTASDGNKDSPRRDLGCLRTSTRSASRSCVIQKHHSRLVLKGKMRWRQVWAAALLVTCFTYAANAVVLGNEEVVTPRIIVQPEDIVYDPSSSTQRVTLNCKGEGIPAPQYRWRKNGQELNVLSDERLTLIGGNLVIDNPQKDRDAGLYECLAFNDLGIVVSRPSNLTFAFVERFSTDARPGMTVLEGHGARLVCDPPEGHPGLVFHWVKTQFPSFVDQDDRVFVSETSGDLYFAQVRESDAGEYQCLVQSSTDHSPLSEISIEGRYSPPITLRVTRRPPGQVAPQLAVSERSVSALRGTTVRMECFAYGNPVPRISWRRLDQFGVETPLPVNHYLDKWNQALIITKLDLQDAGFYECRAASSSGSASGSTQLIVQGVPQFLQGLSSQHVELGGRAHWEVRTDGDYTVSYTWLHNGQVLNGGGRVALASSGSTASLSISGLRAEDSGVYQCVAFNQWGRANSAAELRAQDEPPSFGLRLLPEIIASAGGTVVFNMRRRGVPVPTVTWKKNGANVQLGGRYSMLDGGSLRITGVQLSDGGMYTCQLTNRMGAATSTATLTVQDGSSRSSGNPSRVTVDYQQDGTLPCSTGGSSSSDVIKTWFHNGHRVDLSSDHYVKDSDGSLKILQTTKVMEGTYVCSVETRTGSREQRAVLTVRASPDAPLHVRASDVSSRTGRVAWTAGSDNHSPVTGYIVQGRTQTDRSWTTLESGSAEVLADDRMQTTVSELLPGNDYEFRVLGMNAIGLGEPSLPSPIYSTHSDAPVAKVGGVGGGGGDIGDLVIRWNALAEKYRGGPGFGYKIFFKKLGSTDDFSVVQVTDPNMDHYVHSPDPPLGVFVAHEAKVQAFNQYGTGPMSDRAVVFSGEGPPKQVKNLKAIDATDSSVSLRWDIPEHNGQVIGYRVLYFLTNDDDENGANSAEMKQLDVGPETTTVVGNLTAGESYTFQVKGRTASGYGPYSDAVVAKTREAGFLAQSYVGGVPLGLFLFIIFFLLLLILLFLLCFCCWWKGLCEHWWGLCCACCLSCCPCCAGCAEYCGYGGKKKHKKYYSDDWELSEIAMQDFKSSAMSEEHKLALKRHRSTIVEHVNPYLMTDYLLDRGIITSPIAGELRRSESQPEAVEKILDMLPSRGDPAFYAFCDGLRDSCQLAWLADLLEGGGMSERYKKELIRYRFHLLEHIFPERMLYHLLLRKAITRTEFSLVDREMTKKGANEQLLYILPTKDDDAFFALCEGLRRDCDAGWLADLLEGKELQSHQKELLITHRQALVDNMNPIPIIDFLVSKDILSINVAQDIKKLKTKHEMNEKLLDIIMTMKSGAFLMFIVALRMLPDSAWLADLLEEPTVDTAMRKDRRDMLLAFRSIIINNVKDTDKVIEYLVKMEVLAPAQVNDLNSLRAEEAKCGKLLDMLPPRGDEAFEHFCEALRTRVHLAWLADTLEGEGMTSAKKLQLIRHRAVLVDKMSPEPIITYLSQSQVVGRPQVFSKAMGNYIINAPLREERNERILDLLPSRDDLAFDVFCEALRTMGKQAYLADMLDGKQTAVQSAEMNGVGLQLVQHPFNLMSGTSVRAHRGQQVILEVKGEAKNVRWLYEGEMIPPTKGLHKKTDGFKHELRIDSMTPELGGTYTCEGTTPGGGVACDITIIVMTEEELLL
ncbi:contactin-3-like isoform X5 [Branchiostoma floridae]|uniref:Contactin-3-like isoform X5 n=1 Tax=Branchiostoma floridae TaxID=7739 RepID=A0A9J7LSH8_BRAFL|nr:contactin-3-like isoform X5 [Branchiostoma floridae]